MQAEIVIAEDEAISLLYMKQALADGADWSVEAFADGESAVAYADRRSIAVALLDVGLPGIDGIETARRLRERQDVAVVFITGNTEAATLERARSTDPYAILSKPVDIHQVRRIVREIVRTRYPETAEALHPGFLLDTLYDTARVGMCVTDGDGRFVRVNRAYRDIYGYTADELLGREFTVVLPPEDREHAARLHDEFVSGDLIELPTDWRVQRRDGAIRDVYVTAGRMVGTDGRTYKVTTVTDLTDRRENERRIERALEQNRLLLRELNHRVKNNLNTLHSIIELERSRDSASTDVRAVLKTISSRIRAISAIHQRLQYGEGDAAIDINELVREIVVGLVGEEYDPPVGTSLTLEAAPGNVDVGISLGLIVNELVSNAIEHARPSAGTLEISLALRSEDGASILEVSDNGAGLPADFDPGRTNTLGMQIIQAIAGRHHGTLEVIDPSRAHLRVRLEG